MPDKKTIEEIVMKEIDKYQETCDFILNANIKLLSFFVTQALTAALDAGEIEGYVPCNSRSQEKRIKTQVKENPDE